MQSCSFDRSSVFHPDTADLCIRDVTTRPGWAFHRNQHGNQYKKKSNYHEIDLAYLVAFDLGYYWDLVELYEREKTWKVQATGSSLGAENRYKTVKTKTKDP